MHIVHVHIQSYYVHVHVHCIDVDIPIYSTYSTCHSTCTALTIRVPDVEFWDATGLGIDVIGPPQQSGHALYEADTAGDVKRSVAITITHERVGIGLEEVLYHLLLSSEYCQMEGGLERGGGRERERERGRGREREREREGERERERERGREREREMGGRGRKGNVRKARCMHAPTHRVFNDTQNGCGLQ